MMRSFILRLIGVSWDFDSIYKSLWLNRLMILWSFDHNDKINYFSVSWYQDFENLSFTIVNYDPWLKKWKNRYSDHDYKRRHLL